MPLSAFAAVAVTLALGSLSPATDGHYSQNVTVRTPDDRSPRACADLVVTFDDRSPQPPPRTTSQFPGRPAH